MAYWHETNNIVFELVQPSLVLDGLHLESDIRKINTFSWRLALSPERFCAAHFSAHIFA